ncbi:phage tail protein [Pukyongiella litopenaei]|uniref:Phage tail protein n=1 Tax=Pukyongiella litopenaei TaxID=2605946 RepID=A0A2S0MNE8_9RHOB|nr:phage tail protein [Pukyongiella litopenaei]AVO37404.1 phage tail protein [Pukyongiella litopenaei]
MAEVMMQLGFFQFSIDNATYQRLSRSTEYRWSRQARIGTNDALQFTGLGPETIELEGVIYPHFRGGLGQVDKMRIQASIGIPLPLVSGLGRVLGLWVVEAISEGQEVFAAQGIPHRQDFTMRMARYDGGLRTLLRFI